MSDKLGDTMKEMAELAKHHETVAVLFSGGKDSLVTLDLALRVFPKVIPFFMYFVPDLDFDRNRLAYCKQRFNIEPLLYPHPMTVKAWKTSTYCDPLADFDFLPDEFDYRDIYEAVKRDTGATLLLDGMKKADGMFRRRNIANQKHQTDRYRPLKNWVRWEVLSYLKMRDIPMPDQSQADNAGTSLSITEVLYLHDVHPHDYEIVKSYFPHIEVIVKRREWFGLIKD